MILALSGAVWYQSGVITGLEGDKARLASDVLKCAAANDENQATIAQLVHERDKGGSTCESRLAAKDAIIKKLRDIYEGGSDGSAKVELVKPSVQCIGVNRSADNDHLVNLLDGMLQVVPAGDRGAGGVREAGSTASASGASILSGELGYCVDKVNAQRLVTNVTLLRAWAVDMQTILTSLQTGTN